MSSPSQMPAAQPGGGMPFREFVALIAALMAINALGIDTMLPALPETARALGLAHENQQQWIVSSYMLGFGITHIIYGPLADRYGRKWLTVGGLVCFALFSLIASITTSFETMLTARMLQGASAACTRVIAVAMVRDCYAGRHMARVMSLSFIVFLAVPMLAPAIGSAILSVAPWTAIFHMLAILATVVAIWLSLRLGETLHPEYRRPIDARAIIAGWRLVLTDRASIGYTLGLTCSFGAMVGFISSAQQLFSVTFDAVDAFPLIFAFVASSMAFASLLNSRIVLRHGSRLVSHSALVAYLLLTGIHLVTADWLGDTLASFLLFQFAIMFCSGLLGANFGAMAMERMGAIAGTASSLQGMISTSGGAVIGIIVGQSFDGTAVPVVTGYFVCGLLMLSAVLYAEGGRLFRPHHPSPPEPHATRQ